MSGKFNYDLHIHTEEHSDCSSVTAEEIIADAEKIDLLDGIVLTDHDYQYSSEEVEQLKKRTGTRLKVFAGTEVSHNDTHFLVFAPGLIEVCSGSSIAVRDFVDNLQEQGAAVILAHPFTNSDFEDLSAVKEMGVDGVELYNANRKLPSEEQANAAIHSGLTLVAGSDTHYEPTRFGYCYTSSAFELHRMEDLVRAIKTHKLCPVIKK